MIPIAKVEFGEEEITAALEVLKSGRLVYGEKIPEFEEVFAKKVGAKYALAVSSGTTALHTAYLALIKQGDEVLVPSFSHISTASMISFAGGKPVFCDIDPKTFNIDPDEIRRKTANKTSAVAPVHLFGNACEIDEILKIVKEFNLKVIWDAAQAHGTKYKGKDVGSFENVVCYSFYPTKNMTTGEGGMITTNDTELYERMKLLRSHGQEKKYHHIMLGLNYRMTEVEAAIGIEQLKKLDNMIEKRRKNAELLTRELSGMDGITVPFAMEYVAHSFHQYSILLDEDVDREKFMGFLKERGVATGIHYPKGIHQQPIFEAMYGRTELKNTEYIAQHILSLPVHHGLKNSDVELIITAVQDFFGIGR